MSEDDCMTMDRHACCPIVNGKPKNALPISSNPIVADEEKTAGGPRVPGLQSGLKRRSLPLCSAALGLSRDIDH
jgi:hypothetical protein